MGPNIDTCVLARIPIVLSYIPAESVRVIGGEGTAYVVGVPINVNDEVLN